MIVIRGRFFAGLFLFASLAEAQKLKKEDKLMVANLEQHISFLASDKLEGRRTGTAGEKAAAEYISNEFKKAGLLPKGSTGYLQPFDMAEGKGINPATFLHINDQPLTVNKDFFPLIFSANISMEALPSMALQELQMPWFFDLKPLLEANNNNPHFDLPGAIKKEAAAMQRKGATALFVYNSSALNDGLAFNGKEVSEPLTIPVIYISREAAKKYLADESATLDIKLKVDIGSRKRTGHNVIGYIDNGAPVTAVLGAHYDHLGYGEDGNSLNRGESRQIHNGADDNASGTAALLELARLLKASKSKGNNYLFIAFSGEELGLFGSKHFVENPTLDLGSINFMVNMDMLGRLNDSSKRITVGGYGTSPVWGELFTQTGKNRLYTGDLSFRYDSSGTGPSDHTSFYRKNVPVLFYFTGLHNDYHRPSDDADKINYVGEMHIIKHIFSLLESTNKRGGKMPFVKTREAVSMTSASFSVTLGIMPDYSFSSGGVRVDGVSDNRPAQKAGIQTGDVITALGPYTVTSVENYMQALSHFKKGDKTTVTYKRGNATQSAAVQFE